MALTAKQNRFVDEYLVDLNATQAATRAGYSEKTAAEIGYQNLGKPAVADAIAVAMEARSKRTTVEADRVIAEMAKLAFTDITEVMDWGDAIAVKPDDSSDPVVLQGITLVAAKDLSPKARAAIAEVKQTKDGLSLKMHSKTSAIDMLMKHLGLYKPDRHEHTGKDGGPIETVSLTPTERARRVAALVAEIQAKGPAS